MYNFYQVMLMDRIQKIIANSGYCSRRKAEELIVKGKVMVNGEIVKELGFKANMNDLIEVDGVSINKREDFVYYLLNKPRGVITSTCDDKGRKTVIDLIDTKRRIYPVGRLDYDTTGVLILTNDGNFVTDASYVHTDNNFTTTEKNKLGNIAAGAEVNVQSDWNTTTTTADSFIKNKPMTVTKTTSGSDTVYDIESEENKLIHIVEDYLSLQETPAVDFVPDLTDQPQQFKKVIKKRRNRE